MKENVPQHQILFLYTCLQYFFLLCVCSIVEAAKADLDISYQDTGYLAALNDPRHDVVFHSAMHPHSKRFINENIKLIDDYRKKEKVKKIAARIRGEIKAGGITDQEAVALVTLENYNDIIELKPLKIQGLSILEDRSGRRSDAVKSGIVELFGKLNSKELIPVLVRNFEDTSNRDEFRAEIAKTFAVLGATEVIASLRKSLTQTEFPLTRLASINALSVLNAKSAIDELRVALQIELSVLLDQNIGPIPKSNSADTAEILVTALGSLGDKNAISDLKKIIEIDSSFLYEQLMIRTFIALGRLGEEKLAKDGLLKLFDKNYNNTVVIDYALSCVLGLMSLGYTNERLEEYLITKAKERSELQYYDQNEDFERSIIEISDKFSDALIYKLIMIEMDGICANCNSDNKIIFSYLITGGKSEYVDVIQWLSYVGDSSKNIVLDRITSKDSAKNVIDNLTKAFHGAKEYSVLRQRLASGVISIVNHDKVEWEIADVKFLTGIATILADERFSAEANSVLNHVSRIENFKKYYQLAMIGITHFLFWVLLMFFYVNSKMIQAIFFWNPWVRRIIGLGYVGFLITWIPFLRRLILKPFEHILISEATLSKQDIISYYPYSNIKTQNNEIFSAEKLTKKFTGQIILEGESGLGKTMFLRYYLSNTNRSVIYLQATSCDKGVMQAIQSKLHGYANDENFLKSLIYSGALDICIDGINEVSSSVRANITAFCEQYFKGNILLSTQPMEWSKPKGSITWQLKPLETNQIIEFLFSRYEFIDREDKLDETKYRLKCREFLDNYFTSELNSNERYSLMVTISNPMDLSVIAELIVRGQIPQLSCLRDQQYQSMAQEYRIKNGCEFPLEAFSALALNLRIGTNVWVLQSTLENLGMSDIADCLLSHKIFILHHTKAAKDENAFRFRHEKIWDFFIGKTFIIHPEYREKYLADPRFRGVYFLLCEDLAPSDAESLKELLIEHAAISKDHTLSDPFLLMLRARKIKELSS